MPCSQAVQQQVHLEQLKKQVREDNQRRRDLSRCGFIHASRIARLSPKSPPCWDNLESLSDSHPPNRGNQGLYDRTQRSQFNAATDSPAAHTRLIKEVKELRQKMAEKGVAEFSPWDADTWRHRFHALGETLPDDVKDWFKVQGSRFFCSCWDGVSFPACSCCDDQVMLQAGQLTHSNYVTSCFLCFLAGRLGLCAPREADAQPVGADGAVQEQGGGGARSAPARRHCARQ